MGMGGLGRRLQTGPEIPEPVRRRSDETPTVAMMREKLEKKFPDSRLVLVGEEVDGRGNLNKITFCDLAQPTDPNTPVKVIDVAPGIMDELEITEHSRQFSAQEFARLFRKEHGGAS